MKLDARNLQESSLLETDICIIGAGAAGISMALDFIDTSYEVVILEGGGMSYNEEIQKSYDGTSTGLKYFPLQSSRLHSFGGTTWMWAGMCAPFDNIDFIKREWVADSGWPIGLKDLEPFYEKAQTKLKLEDYKYDLKHWQKKLPKMHSFPLDENIISNKIWEHSKVRFGFDYYAALSKAANVRLFTHAKVVDLIANESVNKIEQVKAKNNSGTTLAVKAKHVVIACGAIQNARLLLASNSQAKYGLGNDNDLVGRYFMEHVEIAFAELQMQKPFSTDLYTVHHGVTKVHAELAITENQQKKHKILNGTASLMPMNIACHSRPRIETWNNKNPLEALRSNAMHMWNSWEKGSKIELSNKYQLISRMEQAPNPNSRVTIGSEKDSLGIPLANLHWELSGLEKKSIKKLGRILKTQFESNGLGHLELMEFLTEGNDGSFSIDITPGWHHMGTTKMNEDPRKGVVDSNCRVHGIGNLFVAGSSCFPTSGAPNPTLTLLALSLRLSDFIKKLI